MHKLLTCIIITLEIIFLKLQPYLSGANEFKARKNFTQQMPPSPPQGETFSVSKASSLSQEQLFMSQKRMLLPMHI